MLLAPLYNSVCTFPHFRIEAPAKLILVQYMMMKMWMRNGSEEVLFLTRSSFFSSSKFLHFHVDHSNMKTCWS